MSSAVVSKVVIGKFANHGDFPHQVTLQTTYGRRRHFCGASIIHQSLVLSAAHCFESFQNRPPHILVVAGEHRRNESDGHVEQVRQVTRLYVHEHYNESTWVNDIALLVLNESLTFNDYVKPIQLRDPSWELPGISVIS